MKRLLLCGVGALSFAFASSAWADSNTVYLGQSGDDQSATIDQGGSGNSVGSLSNSFSQDNGASGAGGNTVTIQQPGTNNSTNGYQSGSGNSASVSQQGDHGSVALTQVGTANGVAAVPGVWGNSLNFDTVVQDLSHPLISGEVEGTEEDVVLAEQIREFFDQGPQSLFGHGGNEIIEQATLAKQRVDAALGCAGA